MIQKVIVNNTRNGCSFISDTTARTPKTGAKYWKTIQIINDTVFTTLTNTSTDAASNAVGSTSFKAGTVFDGTFTAITLASGVVIAYYGEH